jgi:hypothetical protein
VGHQGLTTLVSTTGQHRIHRVGNMAHNYLYSKAFAVLAMRVISKFQRRVSLPYLYVANCNNANTGGKSFNASFGQIELGLLFEFDSHCKRVHTTHTYTHITLSETAPEGSVCKGIRIHKSS